MVAVPDLNVPTEPFSNEPELENSLHLTQIILLLTCLEWYWQDRQDFFAAGNLSIYYTPEDATQPNKFLGPDFFVVTDTVRRHRNSWTVSLEDGKFPNVIVEILSPKTAKSDRTTKKALYQNRFQTPEYFWFNPNPKRLEFQGFRLQAGVYQAIAPNSQGWMWSAELHLYLGVFDGFVRYFTAEGVMVPNFAEATRRQAEVITATQDRITQERQRAEQERQRAEQERQRADRLAEHLRRLGMEPDDL
jgi:Uma2 family endonuclease